MKRSDSLRIFPKRQNVALPDQLAGGEPLQPLLLTVPRRLGVVAGFMVLSGCGTGAAAPSVPVFGSYFPAWIICAVSGVLFAVVLRVIFVRTGINNELPAPPLVYFCAAILGGVASWLFWMGAW